MSNTEIVLLVLCILSLMCNGCLYLVALKQQEEISLVFTFIGLYNKYFIKKAGLDNETDTETDIPARRD